MNDYKTHVSQTAADNIEAWLTEAKYTEYKDELIKMIEHAQWQDLEDAFFKHIEFGTGGMRGVVGPGSNRLNRVTMGTAAQALCQYALEHDSEAASKGVVIACDTRLSSPELSRFGAQVCAGNGFKTYIFESYRSTPELSFALRHLGCATGFVITASHNAPEYNGFKAYWSDGAQLVPPHDKGVIKMADTIEHVDMVEDYDAAVADGRIIEIGGEVDEAYLDAVLAESMGTNRNLKVAYSPLHGAGQRNTLPVLERAGFEVVTVHEQMIPDGHFPTMEDGRANPEKKPANDRVVALMLAEDADIAISNDPDADRLGIMVRQDDRPIYLSGNQTAVLVTDYALAKLAGRGEITPDHYIVKTIVTTDLLKAIAEAYSVECVGNLLVGFKWICEVINQREPKGGIFVTGSEESFGLMKGSYTRDKDGAVSLLIAEYAAELKAEGKTLYDRLIELFDEHGMYAEHLSTMTCEGAQGFADMKKIMASIRENPVSDIDGHKPTAVLDYSTSKRTDLKTGAVTDIDCIAGDVYVMEFGDSRRRITIRPSGTEPILKFYVQWHDQSAKGEQGYSTMMQELENTNRELEGILFKRLDD